MYVVVSTNVNRWLYTYFQIGVISPSAELRVGYGVTNVTVPESDEVATLTVVVIDPIETSFSLIVNTLDGTATGLA